MERLKNQIIDSLDYNQADNVFGIIHLEHMQKIQVPIILMYLMGSKLKIQVIFKMINVLKNAGTMILYIVVPPISTVYFP